MKFINEISFIHSSLQEILKLMTQQLYNEKRKNKIAGVIWIYNLNVFKLVNFHQNRTIFLKQLCERAAIKPNTEPLNLKWPS